ncbi:flavin-linked sulfhydryl oxidase NDAI_0D03940 [Naumovozyma dairenensis CBS 421]|uniref:Sulfhydryl oxidase n=1 Tax=Naumovozyma dairenensis (strain ATCC 10597 / BCRC 20456 / CBS 421 / NBRC 0211 / NRRL Y-12639) TaxID=1071378 RepID=G0WA97_NAUDC|nr:hypothetical protein NDAI_0D03940 [Naumovozyma dairenensis CBS 421]CCD24708.1 hypothetical protein NDAI_0D03940 [Naumovozyma dairenensis CBS 421]
MEKIPDGQHENIAEPAIKENVKFCLPCIAFKTFRQVGITISESVKTFMQDHEKVDPKSPPPSISLPINATVQTRQPIETDLIPGSRTYTREDPPDVQNLGASSWTFLHAMTAKYPGNPSDTQKMEMERFLTLFSHVYPCNWCAKDFEKFIQDNSPKVESREELGRWMCEAHNHVNGKLNKPKFNCDFWEKRWKDGWD